MIYGLVLILHVLVALFLVAVILVQGGRGGLGDALGGAAAQSLFGGGANTVMTKITAVVAAVFMGTSLTLALLSTARGRSVIEQLPAAVEELPGMLPPAAQPPEGAQALPDAEPASPPEPAPSAEIPPSGPDATDAAPEDR